MEAVLGPLDDAVQLTVLLEKLLGGLPNSRADAYRICRLCDPDACDRGEDHCPVTRAADHAEAAAGDPGRP